METPKQIHPLQDLFISAAEIKLPPDPRISWSSYGVMTYYWSSPCKRIQGLWVNVDEYEVMLATALSHTHIDEHAWEVRNTKSGSVLDRIVEQGTLQARSILSGDTVFVKTYDAQGNEDTSSGVSSRLLWNDLEHRAKWKTFHGEARSARAWDWCGEVTG